METEVGHQVLDSLSFGSHVRIVRAREEVVALVDQQNEGRHDLNGDVRQDDGKLLVVHIQGSAGQDGAQGEYDGFVNLNNNLNYIQYHSTRSSFLASMRVKSKLKDFNLSFLK